MSYIRSIYGTPRQCKSQSFAPIQFNIMSTMSELDRLTKQIKRDDIDILADIAHEQEQAMREEMDPPEDIDPDYENFISQHPDGKF